MRADRVRLPPTKEPTIERPPSLKDCRGSDSVARRGPHRPRRGAPSLATACTDNYAHFMIVCSIASFCLLFIIALLFRADCHRPYKAVPPPILNYFIHGQKIYIEVPFHLLLPAPLPPDEINTSLGGPCCPSDAAADGLFSFDRRARHSSHRSWESTKSGVETC